MTDLIADIREIIDTDWLSEYLGQHYAEELEYTDYNIEILKISIEDLKAENYQGIEHVEYVEFEDYDKIKTLFSEQESKAVKKEFEEDSKYYRDTHECSFMPCDCDLSLFKAILYCNEEYVWSATTFSFSDY